jgi:hypothetical protein
VAANKGFMIKKISDIIGEEVSALKILGLKVPGKI